MNRSVFWFWLQNLFDIIHNTHVYKSIYIANIVHTYLVQSLQSSPSPFSASSHVRNTQNFARLGWLARTHSRISSTPYIHRFFRLDATNSLCLFLLSHYLFFWSGGSKMVNVYLRLCAVYTSSLVFLLPMLIMCFHPELTFFLLSLLRAWSPPRLSLDLSFLVEAYNLYYAWMCVYSRTSNCIFFSWHCHEHTHTRFICINRDVSSLLLSHPTLH